MTDKPQPWERVSRETILDTRFVKVFNDVVKLPAGNVLDDYTVVSLKTGAIIVATDTEGNLITFYEYKHGIRRVVLTLPGGGVEDGQSPLETASKELLEETGYYSDELELVKVLHEYPSKLDHSIYVVRAKNARKIQDVEHELTESIGEVHLLPLDTQNGSDLFEASAAIAALALTLPEFLKRV